MRQIHDRQPVILDPAAYDAWLNLATPTPEAKALLAVAPPGVAAAAGLTFR